MPIFMDRHDLGGMTPEDVADDHRKDLEIQDRYGVKYMAYWFDEERGSGFCLVHAQDAAAAERVHLEAHGQIANAIIPPRQSGLANPVASGPQIACRSAGGRRQKDAGAANSFEDPRRGRLISLEAARLARVRR